MITGQAAMLKIQIRGKNMYYAQKIKEDVPIRDVIEYYYGQQPGKGAWRRAAGMDAGNGEGGCRTAGI